MTYRSIQNSFITILCVLIAGVSAPSHAQDQPNSLRKMMERAEDEANRQSRDEEYQNKVLETDSPILVELFTTTDCSECVYADRMLYDASKDKRVIPLSCRIVDLSELESDEQTSTGVSKGGPIDPCVFRQWTYQTGTSGNKDVELNFPTFVFNGFDKIRSGTISRFDTVLNSYHFAYKNRILEVFMQWKDKDTITVHLPRDPKTEESSINASVWIIRYKDMEVQRVDSGVNKGRVLRFSNIIQDIRHIAKWHGHTRSIDVDVPAPEGGKDRGGFVIVVQQMMGEPVLAAGKLVDYPHPNDEAKTKARKDKARDVAAERAKTPQTAPSATVQPVAPAPKP